MQLQTIHLAGLPGGPGGLDIFLVELIFVIAFLDQQLNHTSPATSDSALVF